MDVERLGHVDMRGVLPRLRTLFKADAAIATWDGVIHTDGDVPSATTLDRLRDVCARVPSNDVQAWSRVPSELEDDPEAVRFASGLLYVPVGRDASIVLLRREQVESNEWAGRPPDGTDEAHRLGPRTSFATWREATRGQAHPWSAAVVEAAEAVRDDLVEDRARAVLERRASTDALTGLANRDAFLKVVRERLTDALSSDVVLLLVDLDGFKEVNDTNGHVVGDRLLELVSVRLRHATRDADVTARLGGDEFAVVMHRVIGHEALAAAAARIVDTLGAPYHVDGRTLSVSDSVGAAFAIAGDATDAPVDRADVALYAAKDAGRNRYVIASGADGRGDGAART